MIDLGATEFFIPIPSLPREEFELYSNDLFDEWEQQIVKTLTLPDYYLALEVEEGSIKGTGRIATVLGCLYFGIAQYGSFFTGVHTIADQISTAGSFLAKRAGERFVSQGVRPKVRKQSGTIGSIQRLFVKVQRGEISPEQATIQAEALLAVDTESGPEFMEALSNSFAEVPLYPKQLALPLEALQTIPIPIIEKRKVPLTPYPPPPVAPVPVLPPISQFRVEVWRESKKKKKEIRVVDL
jgi:hypothetical protein